MRNNKLQWGILSTARINRSLIPHLQTSLHSELAAVASRDAGKGRLYAQEKGIPRSYGSYEALLDDPEIDIIYNPLPNHLHAEWSIKALQAGKHVLCEKPMALSLAEMDAMSAAARKSGRVLTEAFMYRHHNQTLQVEKMIASGALGDLRLVRGHFSFYMEDPGNVRWDPAMGGGSLWDVGCYPVSYARTMVRSEPLEAFGWQVTQGGVDLTFSGLLRFPKDILLHFDCSFGAPFRTEIEIIGTKASLLIPEPFKPGQRTTLQLRIEGKPPQAINIQSNPVYFDEIEDIAYAVLHGTAARISLDDSRANTTALLALYQSARLNQPVRLDSLTT